MGTFWIAGKQIAEAYLTGRRFLRRSSPSLPPVVPLDPVLADWLTIPDVELVRAFAAHSTTLDKVTDPSRSFWPAVNGEPFFFSNRGGDRVSGPADWVAGTADDFSEINNVGEAEQVVLGDAVTDEGTEPALLVGVRRRRGTGDNVVFADRAPGEVASFHNRGPAAHRLVEGTHWSPEGPKRGEIVGFRSPAIFTWRSQIVPYDMFDGTYPDGPDGPRPKYPGIRRPEWFYFQLQNCRPVALWENYRTDLGESFDAEGAAAERPAPDDVAAGYRYRATDMGLPGEFHISRRHATPFSIEIDNNENAWSRCRLDGSGNVIHAAYCNLHSQPRSAPGGRQVDYFRTFSHRWVDINCGPPGSFVEWMLIWEDGPTLADKKAVYCKRAVNDLVENGGDGRWKAYFGYSMDAFGTESDSPTWSAWFAARSAWLERITPSFANGMGSPQGAITPQTVAGYTTVTGKSPGQVLGEVWGHTTVGLSSRVSAGIDIADWLFNRQYHQVPEEVLPNDSTDPADPFGPYNEYRPVSAVFEAFDAAVTRATEAGTDADGNPIYATQSPLSATSPWIGISHAALFFPANDARLPLLGLDENPPLPAALLPPPSPGSEPEPEPEPALPVWQASPAGFEPILIDDFQPVSGVVVGEHSWQGVNRSTWAVRGIPRTNYAWNPDPAIWNNNDGTRDDNGRTHTAASHVIVPEGGGLRLYGGRGLDSAGDWPLENVDRRLGEVRLQTPLIQSPVVARFYVTWRQAHLYSLNLWAFGEWVDFNVGGTSVTHGWEMDIETNGSEYSNVPGARSFRPHFNFHLWQRIGGLQLSCEHRLAVTLPLPDDDDQPVMMEFRVGGADTSSDADFMDPTKTYWEWWIEDVQNGVPTGQMVRRYHASPRHHIHEAATVRPYMSWYREQWPDWATPLSAFGDFADAAAISPNVLPPQNIYPEHSPYWDLPGDMQSGDQIRMTRPPSSLHDPEDNWIECWRRAHTIPGRIVMTGGLYMSPYFLAPSGLAQLANYQGLGYADPYHHIDQFQAFAARIDGVAVFRPAL